MGIRSNPFAADHHFTRPAARSQLVFRVHTTHQHRLFRCNGDQKTLSPAPVSMSARTCPHASTRHAATPAIRPVSRIAHAARAILLTARSRDTEVFRVYDMVSSGLVAPLTQETVSEPLRMSARFLDFCSLIAHIRILGLVRPAIRGNSNPSVVIVSGCNPARQRRVWSAPRRENAMLHEPIYWNCNELGPFGRYHPNTTAVPARTSGSLRAIPRRQNHENARNPRRK